MFSRREADRLILDGRVLVNGKEVEVGHKVPPDLQAEQIEIVDDSKTSSSPPSSRLSTGVLKKGQKRRLNDNIYSTNQIAAVVLNKPKGYVSGQAEHGHPPAIRLLTSRNRMRGEEGLDAENGEKGCIDSRNEARHHRHYYDWNGFAPAGRLDMDSTGLLVFTNKGVLAKKLIGATSTIEKEYIADVEPAVCPTKLELAMDPNFVLPSFRSEDGKFDLGSILRGGGMLLGDNRPLKACPDAEWIVRGKKLRLVLTEGRKHQIRRMCRELLGFHVIGLRRVRIGPIVLSSSDTNGNETGFSKSLPEGCWRPLLKHEMKFLLPNAKL